MTNPGPTDRYVPFVDVSQHQGAIDFRVMRSRGIPGVKLRASHGNTRDTRVGTYYRDAIAAGFTHNTIGFYSFINPKRGPGAQTAETTHQIIRDVTGGLPPQMYMLDVESYADEGPNPGTSPVTGPAFAAYIREHRDTFRALSPTTKIIMYSGAAYWDSPQGPRDPVLAAEFVDWIVPRYPLYSDAAYQSHGYPPDPSGWAAYAWGLPMKAPVGPRPPQGATWDCWQFSAGFNRQGAYYGCTSSAVDLNIVLESAWNRWTLEEEKMDEVLAQLTALTAKVDSLDLKVANLAKDEGARYVSASNRYQDLVGRLNGQNVQLDRIEAKSGGGTGGGPFTIEADLGGAGKITGTATPK